MAKTVITDIHPSLIGKNQSKSTRKTKGGKPYSSFMKRNIFPSIRSVKQIQNRNVLKTQSATVLRIIEKSVSKPSASQLDGITGFGFVVPKAAPEKMSVENVKNVENIENIEISSILLPNLVDVTMEDVDNSPETKQLMSLFDQKALETKASFRLNTREVSTPLNVSKNNSNVVESEEVKAMKREKLRLKNLRQRQRRKEKKQQMKDNPSLSIESKRKEDNKEFYKCEYCARFYVRPGMLKIHYGNQHPGLPQTYTKINRNGSKENLLTGKIDYVTNVMGSQVAIRFDAQHEKERELWLRLDRIHCFDHPGVDFEEGTDGKIEAIISNKIKFALRQFLVRHQQELLEVVYREEKPSQVRCLFSNKETLEEFYRDLVCFIAIDGESKRVYKLHRYATTVRISILSYLGEALQVKNGDPFEVCLENYIPTLIIKKKNPFSRRDGKPCVMMEKFNYTDAIWTFKEFIKDIDLRYPLEQAKEFGLGNELDQFIVFNREGSIVAGRIEGEAQSCNV